MYKLAQPFYIRTISSLHCGSGNDLGIIDLPIQREKHTSFPKVEGSSLKGALREAFETLKEQNKKNILINPQNSFGEINLKDFGNEINELKKSVLNYDYSIHLAFGYDEAYVDAKIKKEFGDDTEFSGALGFSDARLLFFPVKSAKGVFAWVTCPYVLKRFVEDMALCNNPINLGSIAVEIGKCVTVKENKVSTNGHVVLEEYTFNEKAEDEKSFEAIFNLFAELPNLKEKLVILSDDDFKDFVNLSTEVITRTKIDNATGTVAQGALFNEEYLPSETIMYYIVFASPVFQKKDDKKGIFKQNGKKEEELVFEFFEKGLPEVIQLGGNATIGKGIIKTKKIAENKSEGGN